MSSKQASARTAGRTPTLIKEHGKRLRYAEPAPHRGRGRTKRPVDGNPVFALRVPVGLRNAIRDEWGDDATGKVKALIAKALKYDLTADEGEE